jgi:hypothetical protein
VNSAVKCPHCGKGTKDGKACDNCGRDLAPSQGMEVQYKDFKVSELLDIKVGHRFPAGKGVEEEESGHETEREMKKNPSSGKRAVGKKRLRVVMTAVTFVLVAIAVFFFLKFFTNF